MYRVHTWLRLLTLTVLVLVGIDAEAATCTVQFCFEYDTDFTDRGGDYWDTNEDRTADGITVTAYPIGGSPSLVEQASDPGGCVSFDLDDTYDYAIWTQSEAVVNGVTIQVWDEVADPGQFVWIHHDFLTTSYHPTDCNVTAGTYDIPASTATAQLAVATRMMGMNNFGIQNLDYYDDDCCSGGAEIRASTTSKTSIAHETGHGIGYRRDEQSAPNFDYSSGEQNCDGDNAAGEHSQVSKEYQSAAAVEGFADLLSAWTWNDTSGGCLYDRQYSSDFDLDGDLDNDAPGEEGHTQCGGVPADGLASYVTGHDWLDDLITASDPAGCTTPLDFRSTQLDWLRYGWDMLHNGGVPIEDYVTIYDAANPHTWDKDNNQTGSHGSTGTADDVIVRWEAAADGEGWGAEHDDYKNNGQDH